VLFRSTPVVRGLWSAPQAERSGLAVGDRLVSVGASDLSGVGPVGFAARVYEQARGAGPVLLRYERAGRLRETQLELIPVPYPWRTAGVAAAFAGIGALTFWRARASRTSRFFFLAVIFYALHWCYFWGGSSFQTHAALAVFLVAPGLAAPFALRTILVFPEEVARTGLAASLAPWIFAATGVFVTTWAFGFPLPPAIGQSLGVGSSVALIAFALGALWLNYRRAGPLGRRQLRWVIFGLYVGLAPAGLAGILALAVPQLWWLYEVALLAVIAIPICLLIAIVRYNLFDIDRLITAAASYTILSVVILSALLGFIPRAVAGLQTVAEPTVTQTLLSLVFVGIVLPAQRRVERLVQRWLFIERHALEEGARVLREALGRCSEPGELLTVFGERLAALLRPESLVIYGRSDGAYAPVFQRGRAVPPAIDAAGPLVQQLARERRALRVRDLPLGARAVSAAERASLAALGADVVLPLVLGEELAALVCIGEKHSGDVYTSTDLALLEGLADRARDTLLRFDQAEIQRQERALMEKLRRYVPGAVVEYIDSDSLEAGEQEVTVLFVDIRGYSSFSEGRRPEAIFSLVSRYTQLVSQRVQEHGGAVVEFNGDGMMAVFGAPRPLAQKERAALHAAHAIVAGMQGVVVDDPVLGSRPLEVGVGIATGLDFVGSVRAVDRSIWTVLGNTTNLAARLQALTRDLDAAIIVDAATLAAAPEAAAGFVTHLDHAIRGRSERVDLHALPRASAAPSA
jgi:class 3 adenylate cyclase